MSRWWCWDIIGFRSSISQLHVSWKSVNTEMRLCIQIWRQDSRSISVLISNPNSRMHWIYSISISSHLSIWMHFNSAAVLGTPPVYYTPPQILKDSSGTPQTPPPLLHHSSEVLRVSSDTPRTPQGLLKDFIRIYQLHTVSLRTPQRLLKDSSGTPQGLLKDSPGTPHKFIF